MAWAMRDAGEREQVEVLGLEEVGLLALEIEHADEAILGDERNGEFGADVGIGGDVALDLGDVVDEHGLTREGNLADDTFAERECACAAFQACDRSENASAVRWCGR